MEIVLKETKIFEEVLTEKEIKKLENFLKGVSDNLGNIEDILSEIENENILTHIFNIKTKVSKYLIKKRIKAMIPIFKKIITSKKVLENSLKNKDEAKYEIEYNYTNSEKLFENYINTFPKKHKSKLFLLIGRFIIEYFSTFEENLGESSSLLKFDKSKTLESKSKHFLELYSNVSENIYQYFMKFLLNCEYIRNNKKLNGNKNSNFGVAYKNLEIELKIKKYRPLILKNSVLIRNAKSHGHKKILHKKNKLKIWNKNGIEKELTIYEMEKELNRLVGLSFNNNILMIFFNFLQKTLIEEEVFELVIDNMDKIIKNINNLEELEEIFEENNFIKNLKEDFIEIFSLEFK